MRITDIHTTKRGRISVYVEGEFAFTLHPDIWATSGLMPGTEVEVDRLEELRCLSQDKMAREKALRLLSGRAYTAKGLKDKLSRFVEEDSASAAVERMEDLGLIDDRDYARRYASDCIKLKGYSLRRTRQALGEKGISREIADVVLEELEFDPEPAIAKIALRKYYRGLSEEKGYAKAVNGLTRLGYEYGVIRAVLENLMEDPDYYNDTEE